MSSPIYHGYTLSTHEIRLLSIAPKSQSAQLRCNIGVYSFSDLPDFFALSYTWGESPTSKSFTIKVDDYDFEVTENLAKALLCLRHESLTSIYWIDAICIDQRNVPEKNVQVPRMKDIYEKAGSVVAWLGEASDDSALAMSAMDEIWQRNAEGTLQDSQGCPVFDPFQDIRIVEAFLRLMGRPWWGRVWIVQESTTMNGTILQCGNWRTSIDAAITFARILGRTQLVHLTSPDRITREVTEPLDRVNACHATRYYRQTLKECFEILWILDRCRDYETSDPRDKIFAFSALSAQSQMITPNYNSTILDTYFDFTVSHIINSKNLDILGHAQVMQEPLEKWKSYDRLDGSLLPKTPLPSWCSDWTARQLVTPFKKRSATQDTTSRRLYSASGESLPQIALSSDRSVLTICGSLIDDVYPIGPVLGDRKSYSLLPALLDEVERLLGPVYVSGERTRSAFEHVLVGDVLFRNGEFKRNNSCPMQMLLDDENAEQALVLNMAISSRRIFLTKSKYLGLAPFNVKKGDKVCLFNGGSVLYVIRQSGDMYTFVGESYVHGLMDGEAMQLHQRSQTRFELQ